MREEDNMHILETMNSIVCLEQRVCWWWWFEVEGLVLGQYFSGNISIFCKYADFKR